MGAARQVRWALIAAALALITFIVIFAFGGLLVKAVVADAFAKSESLRASAALLADVVKMQLDEETGLRGYAATGKRLFLEPYYDGRVRLPQTLAALRAALDRLQLPQASGHVRRAAAINRQWIALVATPLLSKSVKNRLVVEKRGKIILDGFRRETAATDDWLKWRAISVNREMQMAIWRIELFVFVVILAIVILASVFAYQQFRLMVQLDRERAGTEQERIRTRELRAAYQAEKRIADTLQGAFSQRPLPALPSLLLSATYMPATEETKVGGDWYDVLEIPRNRVLFSIGDVAGHGIDAAVTMSRARQSLVSSAVLATDPSAMLSLANADLFAQQASMVTAIAGFADYRKYEFVLAIAGHPPPLLVEPGRLPRLLECGGLPLGVTAHCAYQTKRVQTVPGATLILYTDGAIEHSRDALEGERLFIEATAQAMRTPDDPPAALIYNSIFRNRSVNDDVAILTIGFPRAPSKERGSSSGTTDSVDAVAATSYGTSATEPRRAESAALRPIADVRRQSQAS